MKILIRRGTESNLPATADTGELLFVTDTGELYAGSGSGRVNVKTKAQNIIGLLDGNGKFLDQYMPDLSISTVVSVSTIDERDALDVQTGDVAVVQDNGNGDVQTFMYSGSGWVALTVPGGNSPITINGVTDTTFKFTSDSWSEGTTNLYYTNDRVASYIATQVNQANGIAGLDSNGKLSIDVIPTSVVRAGDNATRLGSGDSVSGAMLQSDGNGNTTWSNVVDGGNF